MIELVENRVYRPFTGGKLLEAFVGNESPADGQYPERWICSTTGSADGKGISCTPEGVPLTQYYAEPLDILVKLIDSYTRLMIQVHPTDAYAQTHFNSQYGKMEAWYILETREIDGQAPYVFLGFQEGVTKEQWMDVFARQDIPAMEACLHKILVKPGDVFLVPGGVPHAMGSGVFFAEVQQPTDLTLRTEWVSPDGRTMQASDLHCGTNQEILFDCFAYDGANLEDTLARYLIKREGDVVLSHPLFTMREIEVIGSYTLPVSRYAIVVVLEGESKGKEFFVTEDTTFIGTQKLLVCTGA